MPKFLAVLLLLLSFAMPVGARTVMCTAYTAHENGAVMANGMVVQEGYVACDFLPIGAVVYLDGNRYVVGDRIGNGSDSHIDIAFSSYEAAIEFGVRYMDLQIE